MSRGSLNIKVLNVEHWRCRKSDVQIKHPIKLLEAAKCNNTAAGPRPSTYGQIDRHADRQTDRQAGIHLQPCLMGRLCMSTEPLNLCHCPRL